MVELSQTGSIVKGVIVKDPTDKKKKKKRGVVINQVRSSNMRRKGSRMGG